MSRIENILSKNLIFLYLLASGGCALLFIPGCLLSYPVNITDPSLFPEDYKYVSTFPTISLLYFAIACLIFGEILFLIDDVKPKKNESIFGFTLIAKFNCILVSVVLLGMPALLISICQRYPKEIVVSLGVIFNFILTIAPYVIFIILLVYLNSLKYRRKDESHKRH